MRLCLHTWYSTGRRQLWSLKTLPESQGMALSSWKGGESQTTDNSTSTATIFPAIPVSIHPFSVPPNLYSPLLNFQVSGSPSLTRAWILCSAHSRSSLCTWTSSWTCWTCCFWQVGLGHMVITLYYSSDPGKYLVWGSTWTKEVTLKIATAKDERSREKWLAADHAAEQEQHLMWAGRHLLAKCRCQEPAELWGLSRIAIRGWQVGHGTSWRLVDFWSSSWRPSSTPRCAEWITAFF